MIERTILTSQQENYTIASDAPAVVEWFTNEEKSNRHNHEAD